MDKRQLALVYLMEECNKLSSLCVKNIHNHKKTLKSDLEKNMGSLFNAMRETVVEFDLKESNVEKALNQEVTRKNKP